MNYLQEYKKLRTELEDVQGRINDLLQAYAKKHCPFKVGHVYPIIGYSHYGKKGVVEEVAGILSWNDRSLSWVVRGRVLKKDGTKSLQPFDFKEYQWEDEKTKKKINSKKDIKLK